jgi:Zn-dependent peptidase ImmA (M78 family)/transcriptional regulator with XRE-family HTH domain
MTRNVIDEIDKKEVGRRLAAARRQKGMTQEEAATAIGLGRTTMVAVEKGDRRIKADELLLLAEIYEREVADFVRPLPDMEPAIAQFRGPLYKTTEDMNNVKPYIDSLEELARNYWELEEMLDKPSKDKYPPEIQNMGRNSVAAVAETSAINERNRLGLGDGPLPILRDLLEHEVGLRIFYFPLSAARGFSEIYFYTDTLGGCMAINLDHPEERRRWSLAHAYGHFLAHRYQPSALEDRGNIPESELFADEFAAYWLMPTSSLTRKYTEITAHGGNPTMADLFKLANYYGVSLPALVLRLEGMGYLARGANNRLSQRNVKVSEAMAELGLTAIPANEDRLPKRYRLLAVEALQKELISEGQFAYFLNLDIVRARHIAELLGELADAAPFDEDVSSPEEE